MSPAVSARRKEPRTFRAAPLTRAAFAPFGEVVAADAVSPRIVNGGRGRRHDQPASLVHATGAETLSLAVYTILSSPLPFRVDLLERHPASAQLFVPMRAARYLTAVAPSLSDGAPDLDRLVAFVAPGDVGLTYHAGIWHLPMTALDRDASFAMLIWETGTAGDTEEYHLSDPLLIDV